MPKPVLVCVGIGLLTLLLSVALLGPSLSAVRPGSANPSNTSLASASIEPTAFANHIDTPTSATLLLSPPTSTAYGRTVVPAASATAIVGLPLPLAGRRIGLDPGHGPRGELGAVIVDPDTGNLILSEAEFNLDVALRCRDILRARGASVVLTRESADTFTAPWPTDANGDGIIGGPKDDLQERVDILNAFHAEAFLSIHVNNAPGEPYTRGVQVFYCSTPDCPFPSQSKQLGTLVLQELQAKLADAGYPVKSADLYSDFWLDTQHLFLLGPVNPPTHVRATQMPGVLSESLYVTSPVEAVQLQRDSVRQAIALAYADALQSFLTGSSNGQ